MRKHLTFPRRRLVQVFTSSGRPGRSLDDCGESLGIVTKVVGIVTKVEGDGLPGRWQVKIRGQFDRKTPVMTRRR